MKATYNILAETQLVNGPIQLIHRTAGETAAGSGSRVDLEAWGAISTARDGTTHGQWFRTLEEAQARYDLVVANNPTIG